MELEDLMQNRRFWQDNQAAQKTSLKELSQLKTFYDFGKSWEKDTDEALELVKIITMKRQKLLVI